MLQQTAAEPFTSHAFGELPGADLMFGGKAPSISRSIAGEKPGVVIGALSNAIEAGNITITSLLLADVKEMWPNAVPDSAAAAAIVSAEDWLFEARAYEAVHGPGSRLDREHYLVTFCEGLREDLAEEARS